MRASFAFIVANTSLTYDDIRDLMDWQVASILEQFKQG